MTFAYADPPYPGCAKKHYGCAEVDHAELIGRLERDYVSWALSTNSTCLRDLLPLCRPGVRVGAWVKPFASFKRGVDPAYAWEPVIFRTARKWSRDQRTVRDWVSANITLKRGLSGVKPDAFSLWLFDLLGMRKGDTLVDLYPGSGAVTRAWESINQ